MDEEYEKEQQMAELLDASEQRWLRAIHIVPPYRSQAMPLEELRELDVFAFIFPEVPAASVEAFCTSLPVPIQAIRAWVRLGGIVKAEGDKLVLVPWAEYLVGCGRAGDVGAIGQAIVCEQLKKESEPLTVEELREIGAWTFQPGLMAK